MRDIVITAEELLKEYHIYDHPAERLREMFLRTRHHKVFRALGPMSVEVRRGEAIGIVGENGAGKSTFLKLVAGVIEPSSGKIAVNGRVSSILELGTGFNPEFTGRENVVLNGALHGFSSVEVNERMERIRRFADIGEFFDMPVKMYSSGMYLRLAFSLAVHVDADIIVIDEALAVGDGAYEKKCIDRIWDLRKGGTTLLYCSHSLYSVANFCDRAFWLKEGGVQAMGETKEVLSRYEDYLREKELREKEEQPSVALSAEKKVAEVREVRLVSGGRPVQGSVRHAAELEVLVEFEIFQDTDVYVAFAVDRNDGLCCYADSMLKQGLEPFRGPSRHNVTVLFRDLPLLGGVYKVVMFLIDETGICVFDRRESTLFKVDTLEKEWGVCSLPHEWRK